MKKFPKIIYVTKEEPEHGEESYFEVNTEVEDISNEDCEVAIYELIDIKKLKVKKELK